MSRIAAPLLEAVAALHYKLVVAGDLSPKALSIAVDGLAMVTSLGSLVDLARDWTNVRPPRSQLQWIAPEVRVGLYCQQLLQGGDGHVIGKRGGVTLHGPRPRS